MGQLYWREREQIYNKMIKPIKFSIYLPENQGGKKIDKFPPYHVWSFVNLSFF